MNKSGRKPTKKSGEVMTERVGMACTKEEYAILQEAMELSERASIGAYIRSVVIPNARNIVTNHRLAALADTFSNPLAFGAYMAQATTPDMDSTLDVLGKQLGEKMMEEAMKQVKPDEPDSDK